MENPKQSKQKQNYPKYNKQKSLTMQFQFTGDDYGCLKIWQIRDKECVKEFKEAHYGSILAMALTLDEKLLVTVGEYGYMKIWSCQEHKLYHDFGDAHNAEIHCVGINNNNIIITGDDIGRLKAWYITSKSLGHAYPDYADFPIWCIQISPNGYSFFTGDASGNIRQYCTKNPDMLKDFGHQHNSGIKAMAISDNGLYLFTGDKYGHQKQWSLSHKEEEVDDKEEEELKVVSPVEINLVVDYGKVHEGGINCITSTSDYLFSAGTLGNFKILKADIDEEGNKLAKFSDPIAFSKGIPGDDMLGRLHSKAHDSQIHSICISNSEMVFTTGHGGHCKLWDFKKVKLVKDWGKIHAGRINATALVHFDSD